jgi:hypothetical protein
MLAWSQTRLLITLGIATLLLMEPVSWLTADISSCIVNPENYGAYYANGNHCPTFHVFLLKCLARVLEHLGDPNWVIADFTVVLALSTIGLWVITWQVGRRQEKMSRTHERAYISGGGPVNVPGKPGLSTVTVQNYGRTPGVVKTLEWGICPESIFPVNMKVSEILDRGLLPIGIVQIFKIEGIYPPNMDAQLLTRHIEFPVKLGDIFSEGTDTPMFSMNAISARSN